MGHRDGTQDSRTDIPPCAGAGEKATLFLAHKLKMFTGPHRHRHSFRNAFGPQSRPARAPLRPPKFLSRCTPPEHPPTWPPRAGAATQVHNRVARSASLERLLPQEVQKPPRSTPSHSLATPRGHGAPHSPTRLPGRSHTASAAHADAQTHLRPAVTRATNANAGPWATPVKAARTPTWRWRRTKRARRRELHPRVSCRRPWALQPAAV